MFQIVTSTLIGSAFATGTSDANKVTNRLHKCEEMGHAGRGPLDIIWDGFKSLIERKTKVRVNEFGTTVYSDIKSITLTNLDQNGVIQNRFLSGKYKLVTNGMAVDDLTEFKSLYGNHCNFQLKDDVNLYHPYEPRWDGTTRYATIFQHEEKGHLIMRTSTDYGEFEEPVVNWDVFYNKQKEDGGGSMQLLRVLNCTLFKTSGQLNGYKFDDVKDNFPKVELWKNVARNFIGNSFLQNFEWDETSGSPEWSKTSPFLRKLRNTQVVFETTDKNDTKEIFGIAKPL